MSFNKYKQTNYKLYFVGVLLIIAVLYVLLQGTGSSLRGIDPFTGNKLLIVWESYSGAEHKLFKEIAKDYEKENPGITINVAQIPWMGQESKYRTSLIAKSPPDIGRVDTTFLPELVKNGVVWDLTASIKEETKNEDIKPFLNQYIKAAIDSCVFLTDKKTLKKAVYGIPDQSNGVCLFYNKDHFIEAGLDPEKPPVTWDEFLEIGKKLTNHEENRYGVGLDNSLWWTFPFFNTHGTKFLNELGTECILNSEAAQNALQFKVDLYRKHEIEGGAWMSGGVNPEVGFTNGKYSMILMGPWNVERFKKAKINFGVALVPEGPQGTSTNVGGTNMVVFKQSTNKKESFKFLKYLTSKEVQAKWSNKLGQIPVNLESFDLVDKSNNKILGTFMEQMKTAISRPKVLKYGQLEEIINPLMESALKGDITVKQALDAAVKKINNEVLK